MMHQKLQKLVEDKKPIQWDAAKPSGPFQISFQQRSDYYDVNCDDAANAWVERYGKDVTILRRTNLMSGAHQADLMVTLEYEVHPPK